MVDVTLWHNPRCSKSRAALALLEERSANITLRRYLDDTPTLAELQAAHRAMGDVPVMDMVRRGEAEFKAAGLGKDSADAALFAAMAAYPKLIERPVAIVGDRAVIGRPPERVLDLF